jgi:hypothetical protein
LQFSDADAKNKVPVAPKLGATEDAPGDFSHFLLQGGPAAQ